MSKYVPPHMRNKKAPKEEPEEKVPEVDMSENNFPPLASRASKPLNKWSGKTFSELASKLPESVEREAPAPAPAYVAPMKRVHITADFVEPDETTAPPAPKGEEDEWTLVDKKVRKKKEKNLEELSTSSEDENTVWANDNQEEYETCWDDRRH